MTLPDDVRQWRRARRAELLARRAGIAASQRRELDATITRLLTEAFPLFQHMTVGFYWPFKREFDPRFAIHQWRERGARAALPLVVEKFAPLQFREWWPSAPMTTGVYDLPIPDGTAVVTPQALLIPPVGFDAQGYRLGYGGGYFDRTLAALTPQPLKIGVAHELSRMATIRPQAHDVPMDFMITEAGVHHVGARELALVENPAHAYELARVIVERRANEDRPG
jgi:5-formyltetrahydrofolate cyclo-ligase